jgi:hypothetical protein
MHCDECAAPLWRAGESAPPGEYARVDVVTPTIVRLRAHERLPASFDGHIAVYRALGGACTHTCKPDGAAPERPAQSVAAPEGA